MANFDRAINEAKNAIISMGLDKATSKVLLEQIREKQVPIRLIGSEYKGTFFAPETKQRILEATKLPSIEEFIIK